MILIRALRHPNYRLFFAGQGVSLVGTWMQRIALLWLMYRLTDSEFMLGLAGFASQVPILLLGPFAGVLADRWNLHRVLVLTQALALVQALLLAILTLTGLIAPWQIIALGLVLGSINAFDMPVRQAFTIQMVEQPADLGNAIALNSFLVNGARLIGPSLAGVLIALIGEGWCFALNAASYLAVIVALLAMTIRPQTRPRHEGPILHGLHEGLRYAWGFAPIREMLLLIALSSLMVMPYVTLMPIFAKDILGGGPSSLGLLMAASGIGAIIGAVYLASRRNVLGLGGAVAVGASVFGLSLAAFACSRWFWWSFLLLVFTGLGMMLQLASSNTILQTIVDDDKRGRHGPVYPGVLRCGAVRQPLGRLGRWVDRRPGHADDRRSVRCSGGDSLRRAAARPAENRPADLRAQGRPLDANRRWRCPGERGAGDGIGGRVASPPS